MKQVEIYEMPLGCCGPTRDPEVEALKETMIKLKKEGINVEKISLNVQPQRFLRNSVITEILNSEGQQALPVTLVDGNILLKGRYPSYEELK